MRCAVVNNACGSSKCYCALMCALTNTGENSLAEGLNFTLAAENAEESAKALENLLTGIFEKL